MPPKTEQNANAAEEQEPQAVQEAQGAAGDGEANEPQGGESDDKKGATVNRHKYERDTGRLQSENEELRKQVEETSKLRKDFDEYRAKQEAEKTEAALKAAGCIDTKAAGAYLEDYKGDVAELKKAKPYLFASEDNSQSTGGAQKGNPDPEDARTKRMRASMGLKNE